MVLLTRSRPQQSYQKLRPYASSLPYSNLLLYLFTMKVPIIFLQALNPKPNTPDPRPRHDPPHKRRSPPAHNHPRKHLRLPILHPPPTPKPNISPTRRPHNSRAPIATDVIPNSKSSTRGSPSVPDAHEAIKGRQVRAPADGGAADFQSRAEG